METKAKILECKFVSEWNGPNGIVYYHELKMDNGDKGQIGTKEKHPEKLTTGNELTYTIEETSRGNKIKAVSGGFKGKQIDPKTQMVSFSMSYCKDLIVGGKLDIKDLEKGFNRIYDLMISKL